MTRVGELRVCARFCGLTLIERRSTPVTTTERVARRIERIGRAQNRGDICRRVSDRRRALVEAIARVGGEGGVQIRRIR